MKLFSEVFRMGNLQNVFAYAVDFLPRVDLSVNGAATVFCSIFIVFSTKSKSLANEFLKHVLPTSVEKLKWQNSKLLDRSAL